MSDRIILVRVLGLGSLLTNDQLVLTSRGTLPYLTTAATLPGVVADLGDQYSSEVPIFESMGSDPSTAFAVLSTAETRAALLGRAKVPVLDGNNAPVTVTTYVLPIFTLQTIGVTDTGSMFPTQRIRIGTIAFEVDAVLGPTSISAKRIWGSPNTPIPMVLAGREAVGMVVYDTTLSTGSVEGLPIVVSTAEVTATSQLDEEVIYRGLITKVGVDTSSQAANQITVQCASLMSYLRNAPFRPCAGQETICSQLAWLDDDGEPILTEQTPVLLESKLNIGMYGTPSFDLSPGTTTARAFQIRDGSSGVASPFSEIEIRPALSISGQIARVVYTTATNVDRYDVPWLERFLYTFDGGFFAFGGYNAMSDRLFSSVSTWVDPVRGAGYGGTTAVVSGMAEVAFVCAADVTPLQMLQDLLFGTVDGVAEANGFRGPSEAAWLPFSEGESFADVVDLASLEAVLQGREDVFPPPGRSRQLQPLPYDAGNAKTVGDVLSLILKRLGAFCYYDRGKIRFGSWAVVNPIPTVVTDAALAEPRISLDFDRSACLQAVNVEMGIFRWRTDSGNADRGTVSRPITNIDLGAAGLGKTITMGTFRALAENTPVTEAFFLGSSFFTLANQAMVRYSQPAARVTVSYRDAVADLTVGETVAFSTAYLPSATGAMGVELAVGIVLKAARSWKTPTTEYELLLFGYTQASAAGVPLVAPAARATGPAVAGKIPIEPVWFTRGTTATGGAPTSDAAAFQQSLAISGSSSLGVILLDANGTEIGGGPDSCYPNPVTNELVFPGPPFLGTPIVAGYVISLAPPASNPAFAWDAYQANAAGEVNGNPNLFFPWVV